MNRNCEQTNNDEQLTWLRSILEEPLEKLNLERLAVHNRAYCTRYSQDRFGTFVEVEWPYYKRVLNWYLQNVPRRAKVLEIGTFVPVMPLMLAREGYLVTTVEDLEFYGDALDPMLQLLDAQGIEFFNRNVVTSPFLSGSFDCVNLLCVVEHLLGSPKALLDKIWNILPDDGALVFAVPNQARLSRRLGLFFGGISVAPDYRDYFESEYPFEGHHREYVFSEAEYALKATGFNIELLESVRYPGHFRSATGIVNLVANVLPKTFHQVIFAVGRKRSSGGAKAKPVDSRGAHDREG